MIDKAGGQPQPGKERRVSARVETILGGWWKRSDERFRRCRTLDVGLDGALIALDVPLEAGDLFELHLEVEPEWSVKLEARTLSSRPIFFGKQHLTTVAFKFAKTSDRSTFGVWLQRQLAGKKGGAQDYLKPALPSPAREGEEPTLGPATRLAFVEDRWRRLLYRLTAKIPWREAAEVPNERRAEHRGQIGLDLTLTTPRGSWPAELLNVSFSGASIFIPEGTAESKRWPVQGGKGDLVVDNTSLLLGGRRCQVEVMWTQAAKVSDGEEQSGRAYGLRFRNPPKDVKTTFVGDLLRRISYDSRQVRSELRFPVALPAQVRLSPDSEPIAGQTLDLGAGGALLILADPVPTPGDGLLDLPNLKATLSVRFLREIPAAAGYYSYAVAFRKGQAEPRLKLSRWLAGRMRVQTLGELFAETSDSHQPDDSPAQEPPTAE